MPKRSRPFRVPVHLASASGLSLEEARLALVAREWADSVGGDLVLCLPPRAEDRQTASLREDLRWLGLTWDGEERCRGERRHESQRDLLAVLVEAGVAYPCACPDPLPKPCPCARAMSGETASRGTAVKLRRPPQGIRFTDRVAGSVTVPPGRLDGHLLAGADGRATPLLAELHAAHTQEATHLLRARPIVEGAALVLLFRALGGPAPEFAHIPPLHVTPAPPVPDLGDLRQAGFLPHVLREALPAAGLRGRKHLRGAPPRGAFGVRAVLTLAHLRSLNRRAVRELDPRALAEAVAPGLVAAGLLPPEWSSDEQIERFARAVACYLGDRVTLLSEAAEALAPVFCYDPETPEPSAREVLEEPDAAMALCAFAEKVEASNLRQPGAYPRIVRQLAARLKMPLARLERYLAAGLIGRPKVADLRALIPLFSEGCALELPSGVAGPVERAWDAYYRLAMPSAR